MFPFIDIHTHLHNSQPSVIQTVNVFHDEKPPVDGFFSIGVHPWHIDEPSEINWQRFEINIQNKRCIAVGECGIDTLKGAPLATQREIFIHQMLLAKKHKKPLIVHSVRSFQEILSLREKHIPDFPMIFHGFNQKLPLNFNISKNLMFSFGKSLFHKSSAGVDLIKQIDIKHILLETDDTQCSIESIYSEASRHTGTPVQELREILYNNFFHFYKLPAND